MTNTPHGHYIPGTSMAAVSPIPDRCGGMRWCGQCQKWARDNGYAYVDGNGEAFYPSSFPTESKDESASDDQTDRDLRLDALDMSVTSYKGQDAWSGDILKRAKKFEEYLKTGDVPTI